jgi:hypothetical protein
MPVVNRQRRTGNRLRQRGSLRAKIPPRLVPHRTIGIRNFVRPLAAGRLRPAQVRTMPDTVPTVTCGRAPHTEATFRLKRFGTN